MAERLSDQTSDSTKGEHNVQHRTEQLQKALEELYQADKRIAASTERHLTPDRAVKSDIKKRVRTDLNMPANVLQARYQSYKLERTAIDANDDKTLDVLRELYDIAPIGEQINMMEGLDGDAAGTA